MTLTLGQVAHLKGFASRLDFADAETADATASILAWLRRNSIDTVVWDGDDLSLSSFTHVVDQAHRTLAVSLVAFKYKSQLARLHESWRGRPVTCVPVDDATGYADLGVAALRRTGARATFARVSHAC